MKKRPLKKRIKYTALYYFVRFLIFLSNLLPRKVWLAFCGWLGKIAYSFSPKPRERTIYHLGLAFSGKKSTREILDLSKQVFVMLGKNAGDILRSLKVKSLADLEKFLVTEGLENYERAHAKGKGVMFLTSHLGAFDLQVTNMALRGLKPNIIGTALKDERLNELLFEYRNAFGAIAIERGKESVRLFKILKSGGSIAILIDQDTKVKSRFVNFFGMQAATPIGATVLALRTGCAVVPTYIYLGDDGKQHMCILPEIPLVISGDEETDLVVNTQNFTNVTEQIVRAHPEQWVWMHERWKTKPGQEIR
ncbi:MAG: lipid A biosynthesis acyltransferase [Bacteroidetes bacterium OLB12]|nr:MAG: lipid A biosynthesis acyltransferase [Bacteroidetes bacterium OLB12]HNR73726.1 lysophospholipid acyltransferase family protein [Cyclobacteriaceae bacterium]HNU42760.1 lysophospholipid acyltransferase family protein [Cyclobacteriaceae bacterium]